MDRYHVWAEKVHEDLVIKVKQIDIISSSGTLDGFDSSTPNKSTITFTFSLKNDFSVWALKPEFGGPPQYLGTLGEPLQQDHILINLDQFRSGDEGRENARQLVDQKLRGPFWVITDKLRQQWIDMALDTAREVVTFMPATHDTVSINFNVTIASKLLLDAKKQAIWHKKVAEGKKFRSTNTDPCSICLIQFNRPSDSFLTPCGHNFHEHCLEKWLRIQQRCPICRFNLPFGR